MTYQERIQTVEKEAANGDDIRGSDEGFRWKCGWEGDEEGQSKSKMEDNPLAI